MIGPILDSGALAFGGLTGVIFGNFLPKRTKDTLPLIFGIITISMGAVLTGKAVHFPVVVMSLITGSFLGELFYAEKYLEKTLQFVLKGFKIKNENEKSLVLQLITLISAFCFGSMGIFGAINEGTTGNPEILFTKAILDFFSGLIFGASLGYPVILIAIPQFFILIGLCYLSTLFMPYINTSMLDNFSACGGIIFLATGLRLCGIKNFPVINMLPSLLLVFPFTSLWLLLN